MRARTWLRVVRNNALRRRRFCKRLVYVLALVCVSTWGHNKSAVVNSGNFKESVWPRVLYEAGDDDKVGPPVDANLNDLPRGVIIYFAVKRCKETMLGYFERNPHFGYVKVLRSTMEDDAEICKAESPHLTFMGLGTFCPETDVSCRSEALTQHLAQSQDLHSFFFCVDCHDLEKASAQFYHAEQLIAMSYRDFEQLVWIESLSMSELANWYHASFSISVVTTCRMETLMPLLERLQKSYYFGDKVDLTIAVEAGSPSSCLRELHRFEWQQGPKRIHRRILKSSGPQVAVPESVLSGDTRNHIILEDDLLVSTQFYSWLKFVHLQLQESPRLNSEHIYSVSLYTPRVLETGHEPRLALEVEKQGVKRGETFLFEVPCSWGAAFTSGMWLRALSYFETRLEKKVFPDIPHSRVNGWRGSWKKWLTELGYYEHWSIVYPFFTGDMSFSTNLLGRGEHIQEVTAEMRKNYTVPIFEDSRWYDMLIHKRIFDTTLQRFDLTGNLRV